MLNAKFDKKPSEKKSMYDVRSEGNEIFSTDFILCKSDSFRTQRCARFVSPPLKQIKFVKIVAKRLKNSIFLFFSAINCKNRQITTKTEIFLHQFRVEF